MKQKRGQKFSRDNGVSLFAKSQDGSVAVKALKRTKILSGLAQCTEKQWQKGIFLKVHYQADVENSGTFYNKTSLQEALRIWLEPDLVEYCTDRGW